MRHKSIQLLVFVLSMTCNLKWTCGCALRPSCSIAPRMARPLSRHSKMHVRQRGKYFAGLPVLSFTVPPLPQLRTHPVSVLRFRPWRALIAHPDLRLPLLKPEGIWSKRTASGSLQSALPSKLYGQWHRAGPHKQEQEENAAKQGSVE